MHIFANTQILLHIYCNFAVYFVLYQKKKTLNKVMTIANFPY